MTRPTTLAGALVVTGILAAAPVAAAADQTVQAVDGSAANGFQNSWSPSAVTIRAGETVTWSFTGATVPHNVASTSSNWSFSSGEAAVGQGPASHPFAAPGTYTFVCQIHSEMSGAVTVNDAGGNPPPPPPPPPPSEQPFPNDASPLEGIEYGGLDRKRPKLRRVRMKGVRNGARVRFRVSERARVSLRVRVRGIPVKTKYVRAAKQRRTVTIRGLRAGRYHVVVRAVDPAGNRSRAVTRRVRFR